MLGRSGERDGEDEAVDDRGVAGAAAAVDGAMLTAGEVVAADGITGSRWCSRTDALIEPISGDMRCFGLGENESSCGQDERVVSTDRNSNKTEMKHRKNRCWHDSLTTHTMDTKRECYPNRTGSNLD